MDLSSEFESLNWDLLKRKSVREVTIMRDYVKMELVGLQHSLLVLKEINSDPAIIAIHEKNVWYVVSVLSKLENFLTNKK